VIFAIFTRTSNKELPMTIVDETGDGVKCAEFSEVIRIDEEKVRSHLEEVM